MNLFPPLRLPPADAGLQTKRPPLMSPPALAALTDPSDRIKAAELKHSRRPARADFMAEVAGSHSLRQSAER